MRKYLLVGHAVAMLGLSSIPAFACNFGGIPTPLMELLAHSRNVGIVHVVSSEVVKEEYGMIFITAHVKRIETLRGKPYSIRTIWYRNTTCVNLRLDVGDYFLLVSDNEDQDYMLGIFGENVVSLYAFGYMPPEAWAGKRDPSVALAQLRLAIARKGKLPYAEISEGYKRTGVMFLPMSDPSQHQQEHIKLKRRERQRNSTTCALRCRQA